jgi:hypothetical protein
MKCHVLSILWKAYYINIYTYTWYNTIQLNSLEYAGSKHGFWRNSGN